MRNINLITTIILLLFTSIFPQKLQNKPAVNIVLEDSLLDNSILNDDSADIQGDNIQFVKINDDNSGDMSSDNTKYKIENDESILFQYQGLIGAIVGALGAALIALYSIKKTHRNSMLLQGNIRENQVNDQIKQEQNNNVHNEKLYCGLLYIVHNELMSHESYSSLLIQSIRGYQDYIISNQELPTSDPFYKYPFDLLQEVVIDILEFDMFNTTIIGNMSPYIQKIKKINHDLNLTQFRKMGESDKTSLFFKGIKEYLDIVIEDISDTDIASKDLRNQMKLEIDKFSHSEIVL